MPTIDRVAFSIFGIDIYWYAIIIVCGMIVGVSSILLLAKHKKLNPDDLLDIILFAIPIGIIGARLYYVITDWDETWTFAKIFAIRDGGLAIYGGIIGGLITGIVIAKIKKMTWQDMLAMLDLFAVGVIIGQSIGRWGNFVNQEAYGQLITNPALQFFPFAVNVHGSWYHATFFYESMWNLVGYIGLLILNIKKPDWKGISCCSYFVYYGLGRAWIEGLRSDSLYFLKNILGETIRISQALSIILVLAGIACIIAIVKVDKKHPEFNLMGHAVKPEPILVTADGASENVSADTSNVEKEDNLEYENPTAENLDDLGKIEAENNAEAIDIASDLSEEE